MSIYQHFRKHEHPFVDQVMSWVEQVERNYTAYVTDFLDPRQRQILGSLIGTANETIQFAFFGGYEKAERQRAIIAPFYEELEETDFDVVVLEANYPGKFMTLTHRDVLGAFMSLGIDRKKVGDIIVTDDRFQLLLANELTDYVKTNLTQIKKASIQLREKPFTGILPDQEEWSERSQTVSSLRLDILVKEMYRMSRKDASQLIQANRVKVNFTDVDDPALQLLEGDLISVRGYGRSKLVHIGNRTRKDKLHVTLARLQQ